VKRDPLIGWEKDYFMIIGRIAVYITLILHIPVNFNPLRRTFWDIFISSKMDMKKIPGKQ
jgi:hypothetical protein